jgi:hypothetical protein
MGLHPSAVRTRAVPPTSSRCHARVRAVLKDPVRLGRKLQRAARPGAGDDDHQLMSTILVGEVHPPVAEAEPWPTGL